jgi:hypothetical protein
MQTNLSAFEYNRYSAISSAARYADIRSDDYYQMDIFPKTEFARDMTKLLIVAASSKIKEKPKDPVQALERFDGMFIKQISKHYESLQDVDVFILSPVMD